MTPFQLSTQLRYIAAKISNSKFPRKDLVARDLKLLITKITKISTSWSDLIDQEPDEDDGETKIWRLDGGREFHITNGTKSWYLNGETHREDGPAIEYEDGYEEWWLNGNYHGPRKPPNWDELVEEERVRQIMED